MNTLPLLFVLITQTPEPGDNLLSYHFPDQKQVNQHYSKTLTAIEAHLPIKYGNTYYSTDHVTHGHETTHGINSYLRSIYHKPSFFIPPDRAVVLNSPKVTLQQIAALVPRSLQNSRYHTYLVKQQKDWNNEPLYIFDEWIAYINGALVGFEYPANGNTDIAIAPMEFSYYALALCLAAEQSGYKDEQFKEFVAFSICLSVIIYDKGMSTQGFRWKTTCRECFIKNNDAQPLRDLALRWFGNDYCRKYLGLQ